MALPGATVNGNTRTPGTMNSVDEEGMPVTVSGQCPVLVKVSGKSAKESMHTFPKLPVAAMIVTRRGAGAVPERRISLGLAGSSLVMVIKVDFGPTPMGWRRMGTSIETPAPMING